MIKSIQNIRVFLSSPSDVQIERSKVFKIADICFFFKTDGFTANDIDIDQFTLVKEFKRKISEIGCYRSEIKGDDFDNNIRNLLTTILIDWDRISNRQELGLSKDSISLQLHNIDEDIGYYDAISLSIDELEKSTQITTIFTKAGLIFNEAMLKTKSKLDLCSTDKEKSKIINIFSEDVDAFSLV